MQNDLKSLLSKLLESQPSWKATLIKEWPIIIGTLQDKIILEKIDKNTLILGVTHPAWIQEFSALKGLMLKTINDHLGAHCIEEIRFRTVPPKKPKMHSPTAPVQQPKKTRPLSSREERALEVIKDAELKTALLSFLQRCSKPY